MSTVVVDADTLVFTAGFCKPSNINDYFINSYNTMVADISRVHGPTTNVLYVTTGDQRPRYRSQFDYNWAYKGNRVSQKPPPALEESKKVIKNIASIVGNSGTVDHVEVDATVMEADDYVTFYATTSLADNNELVAIAGVDKDLLQAPGVHYNYSNGEMAYVDEIAAAKYFCYQMLMGDTADNIKGIKGIGPKKAFKILDTLSVVDSFLEVKNLYITAGYTTEDLIESANKLWMMKHDNYGGLRSPFADKTLSIEWAAELDAKKEN